MEPLITNPCYCIHLRRAANRITEYYDAVLKPFGITVNQYSIMANLSEIDGCSTVELATKLQLEKSTLVRTLKPLLKSGYIVDASPAGSRARKLHLTPSGWNLLTAMKPAWRQAQAQIKEKLGKDNMKSLIGMLSEL